MLVLGQLLSCLWLQKEEDAEDPDAESRVNAVRALAASAQTLYGEQHDPPTSHDAAASAESAQEPSDSSSQLHPSSPAKTATSDTRTRVQSHLCCAVSAAIAALDDYSIDNRYVSHT